MIWAVIFLASLSGCVCGAWNHPERTIRGWAATLTIGGMVLSGVLLSLNAL